MFRPDGLPLLHHTIPLRDPRFDHRDAFGARKGDEPLAATGAGFLVDYDHHSSPGDGSRAVLLEPAECLCFGMLIESAAVEESKSDINAPAMVVEQLDSGKGLVALTDGGSFELWVMHLTG
jgi:hypothetical protein